jgi:hypothetical protein
MSLPIVTGVEKQERIEQLRRINSAARRRGVDPDFCDVIDAVLLEAEDVATHTTQ